MHRVRASSGLGLRVCNLLAFAERQVYIQVHLCVAFFPTCKQGPLGIRKSVCMQEGDFQTSPYMLTVVESSDTGEHLLHVTGQLPAWRCSMYAGRGT